MKIFKYFFEKSQKLPKCSNLINGFFGRAQKIKKSIAKRFILIVKSKLKKITYPQGLSTESPVFLTQIRVYTCLAFCNRLINNEKCVLSATKVGSSATKVGSNRC